LLALREEVIQSLARSEPLEQTLERICRSAERLLDQGSLAVVAVDVAGMLHWRSGPDFPIEYATAIDGVVIGPRAGTCGTAIYRDQVIETIDLANDPGWASYKSLATPLGFRSCVSFPVHEGTGKAIGAVAAYLRASRSLTQTEKLAVEECVRLCELLPLREYGAEWGRIDALTRLPDKAAFEEALSHLPCELSGTWGLLLIDLDNLRHINDTLGASVADTTVATVANRIAAELAPDFSFRLSGTRLAAIIQNDSFLQDLDSVADRVIHTATNPLEYSGGTVVPGVTIGGAVLSPQDRRPGTVFRNAEYALYQARNTNPGGFVRFRQDLGAPSLQRRDAVQDVKLALKEGRVDAHYQPILRLDTYEIVGFEALCRMTGANGQILPAAFFQEAFDDPQIGLDTTERMLDIVAQDIRSWLDECLPVQHVGVNFTFADFYMGNAVSRVDRLFGARRVPVEHLVVEVTEQAYIGQRDEVVARGIADLRGCGIRVALDDFGTGFAALTHLMNIPVDIIKIDQSFTRRLAPSHPSMAIVSGIIRIAHELGIKVVTEGIETFEQIGFLREMGCALGQGYAFSKPVSRRAATQLLHRHAQHVVGAKPLTPTRGFARANEEQEFRTE
jgi:diguanylate cyclase (GGDEF)-like protein